MRSTFLSGKARKNKEADTHLPNENSAIKMEKTTLDSTLDIRYSLFVFVYSGIRLQYLTLFEFDFGQFKCDEHKVLSLYPADFKFI